VILSAFFISPYFYGRFALLDRVALSLSELCCKRRAYETPPFFSRTPCETNQNSLPLCERTARELTPQEIPFLQSEGLLSQQVSQSQYRFSCSSSQIDQILPGKHLYDVPNQSASPQVICERNNQTLKIHSKTKNVMGKFLSDFCYLAYFS